MEKLNHVCLIYVVMSEKPCSLLLFAGSQDPFQMLLITCYLRIFSFKPLATSCLSLEARLANVDPVEAIVTLFTEWRCREVPVEG